MNAPQRHPYDQSTYQVRFGWSFEWEFEAPPAATGVDAVVLVDVLPGVRELHGVLEHATVPVVSASLRNAGAVADWVVARQRERGDRFRVLVVAVGDLPDGGTALPSVEDQLGAGAVIDALGERGVDHCSPEAAVVGAGFAGLRRAVVHLVRASATGRALVAQHPDAPLSEFAALDADRDVPVCAPGSRWEGRPYPHR